MESQGHQIKVLATPRKIVYNLLDHYDIEYCTYSSERKFDFFKIREQLRLDYETWKLAKDFSPDILTAIGGTSVSHTSKFVDGISVVFTDSERADLQNRITYPFADKIYTPNCYRDYIGSKHVRYPGYHELAYLHPNRFSPNKDVLEYIDASKNEKIIILRFIAWKAIHDVGQSGFSINQKRELVNELSKYGKVYITSESKLPDEFENHRLSIPIHYIHDLLYYSDLYIGDSQTMATEAAVLGTPSIRSNSFAGKNDMGNFIELENKYRLLYNFSDSNQAIEKGIELAQKDNLKNTFKKRLDKLLEDKIDVTKFLINLFSKLEKEV